jgi:hypothetical protein
VHSTPDFPFNPLDASQLLSWNLDLPSFIQHTFEQVASLAGNLGSSKFKFGNAQGTLINQKT